MSTENGRTFNRVQCCSPPTVAVAFDPVYFHAPLGACGSTIAVIALHEAARRVCDRWAYRVDVSIYTDVYITQVQIKLHRTAEQVERGFCSCCTTAHVRPATIFQLVNGTWRDVGNRQVAGCGAVLEGLHL